MDNWKNLFGNLGGAPTTSPSAPATSPFGTSVAANPFAGAPSTAPAQGGGQYGFGPNGGQYEGDPNAINPNTGMNYYDWMKMYQDRGYQMNSVGPNDKGGYTSPDGYDPVSGKWGNAFTSFDSQPGQNEYWAQEARNRGNPYAVGSGTGVTPPANVGVPPGGGLSPQAQGQGQGGLAPGERGVGGFGGGRGGVQHPGLGGNNRRNIQQRINQGARQGGGGGGGRPTRGGVGAGSEQANPQPNQISRPSSPDRSKRSRQRRRR